ncbi:hypothetical protein A9Z42_0060610 [Trichoderma parareesei]|uniref:Uncharacterized protein n=1 Tax=Trichoderma parareesei TaxID=858221 RepID=A0A2H2ZZX9_TRIPA|nr:hypothetical protein A9Z42_0060610 [Trichoderma parareesei]
MPSSLRSPSSTSASSSSTSGQLPSTTGGSHRSSKSSSWRSEYLPLPRDKGLSLRFVAYAAGASLPTTVKKMTRLEKKNKDGQNSGSGGGDVPRWDFFGRDTQLFWVVVPEDRRQKKRGRSRTSREGTQQRSRSAASSQAAAVPEVNHVPPEISSSRGPPGIVPPQAGGAPVYGQPKPVGFPFGIPPVVALPGGTSMPSFGRKQTC